MIQAHGETPDGPVIVLGLTDDNIAGLKAGRIMKIDLSAFGDENLSGNLAVLHGATDLDIEKFMRKTPLRENATVNIDPMVDQMAEVRARHEKILICTVGLPRSGKTTWAQHQHYPIVNPDSIRLELHGKRYDPEQEPRVWEIAKIMVGSLFRAGHRYVILDATNVTAKRRAFWIDERWATFFRPVRTPAGICKARALKEDDFEIVPVIQRMDDEFELLGLDDMIWPT